VRDAKENREKKYGRAKGFLSLLTVSSRIPNLDVLSSSPSPDDVLRKSLDSQVARQIHALRSISLLIETAKELVKRRIIATGSSCNSTIFQRSSVGVNLNVFTGILNAELQARINIMYLRYSNVGAAV